MATGAFPPELLETILTALERAGIGTTVTIDQGGSLERVYVNEAGAAILGATVDEALGIAPLDRVLPRDRERLAAVRSAMHAGVDPPPAYRVRVEKMDGRVVPVDVAVATSRFGDRFATVAFLRDVSDAVALEERLRASEARFRLVSEAAPDAIVVSTPRGVIRYANPAAAALLGLPCPEAAVGRSLGEFVIEEDRAVMAERIGRVLGGERLRPLEYRVRHADGALVSVEISSIPIEQEGETLILAFGRDVTDRKKMQSRLIHADRLATIGTLATGVAHEVNNPLTFVVLHLEKLRLTLPKSIAGEAERAEALRLLGEALEGAERVRVIVQDLLSLSRSDGSARHAPTDVRRVVETAIKLARPVVEARARVDAALEPTVLVRADPAWLGQVFVNLLVNAGQAFAQPDPSQNVVRVSTRTTDDGDVVVEVADNGPGIPADIADRIYDPFFTTKPAGTGTGLGLAISRSVIDALGGELEATPRPGGGTVFRVSLPAAARTPEHAVSRVDTGHAIRTALAEAARRSSVPPGDE